MDVKGEAVQLPLCTAARRVPCRKSTAKHRQRASRSQQCAELVRALSGRVQLVRERTGLSVAALGFAWPWLAQQPGKPTVAVAAASLLALSANGQAVHRSNTTRRCRRASGLPALGALVRTVMARSQPNTRRNAGTQDHKNTKQ